MTEEERRKQQENAIRKQMNSDIMTGFLATVGIPAILVIIITLIIVGAGTCTGSLKDGSNAYSTTVSCPICGRDFKKETDNAKSINRTNMCSNCYKNYKYTAQ